MLIFEELPRLLNLLYISTVTEECVYQETTGSFGVKNMTCHVFTGSLEG